MDPNATLAIIRELVFKLLNEAMFDAQRAEIGTQLADAVDDLDVSLTKGGMFPRDWRPF